MHTYLYTDELKRVRNAQNYFEGDEENLKYSYSYPEVILCIYMYIHIYTYLYMCVQIFMDIYEYICMYLCIYIRTCERICMYKS
jgi:hypothetical protein